MSAWTWSLEALNTQERQSRSINSIPSSSTDTALLLNNSALNLLGDPASVVSSVSGSALCTDCTHGLVSALSSLDNGTLSQVASRECGTSFSDGQIPSTLSVSNGSSSGNGTSTGTTTSMGSTGAGGAGSTGSSGTVPPSSTSTAQPTSGAVVSLGASVLASVLSAVVFGAYMLA